jgi:predicted nucleic acid-binding protein
MPVVSNTSPLSNLAIIGHLDLLRDQFGEVLIPEAVATELDALGHARGRELVLVARNEGWIRVCPLTDFAMADLLAGQLDSGESEAIALATELKIERLLMDEREGRSFARRAGLRVTGVLGVLLRAKLDGRLPAIRPAIETLRADARFFITKELELRILAEAGE